MAMPYRNRGYLHHARHGRWINQTPGLPTLNGRERSPFPFSTNTVTVNVARVAVSLWFLRI
jgi:hypothetical protein